MHVLQAKMCCSFTNDHGLHFSDVGSLVISRTKMIQ